METYDDAVFSFHQTVVQRRRLNEFSPVVVTMKSDEERHLVAEWFNSWETSFTDRTQGDAPHDRCWHRIEFVWFLGRFFRCTQSWRATTQSIVRDRYINSAALTLQIYLRHPHTSDRSTCTQCCGIQRCFVTTTTHCARQLATDGDVRSDRDVQCRTQCRHWLQYVLPTSVRDRNGSTAN